MPANASGAAKTAAVVLAACILGGIKWNGCLLWTLQLL